jgi:hypothetical protein
MVVWGQFDLRTVKGAIAKIIAKKLLKYSMVVSRGSIEGPSEWE